MTQPATAPDTVTMFRPETGEQVEVPAAQAAEAYASGAAGFRPDQSVAIQTPKGMVRVSGAEAAAYLQSSESITGGIAGERAFAKQEERRSFDTFGQQAAAAGLGAARGLTIGGSDALIAGLGGEDARRYLQHQQEYNPGASLLGEGVGTLAPLLFSGGGSLAAKGALTAGKAGLGAARVAEGGLALSRAAEGASLLGRGVTAAGELATAIPRGVTALGEGAGALAGRAGSALGLAEGGTAASILHGTAQAAAEGALYGAGQAVSEASIKGDPLTIDKIMAGAGHGLLLGGGIGGALGVGGALVRGAARKAEELALKLSEGSNLSALAGEFGEHKAIQAAGGNLKMTERLEALEKASAGTKGRVAEQMTEQLPELAGQKSLATMSHKEIAEAAEKNAERWGKKVGASIDDLDKLQSVIKPDLGAVVAQARKEVVEPLASLPGRSGQAATLEHYLTELETQGAEGVTFKRLHELRRDLDKQIGYDKMKADPLTDARKDIRRLLEGEMFAAGDKAAAQVGAEFSLGYKQAKEQYMAAAWTRDAAAKGAASEAKNRSNGLSELFGQSQGGQAGSAAGTALGSILAGPAGGMLGGLAGHAVGSIAGQALQNLTRRYGDQIAATVAMRAAKGDMVKAVVSTFDDAVGKGVAGLLGQKVERLAAGVSRGSVAVPAAFQAERESHRKELAGTTTKDFDDIRARLAAMVTDPKRIGQATAGLHGASPDIIAGVQQRALTGAQFLQSKLPTSLQQTDSLTPQLDKAKIPDAEKAKWLRYVRAVDDPLSVIDDMKRGQVSAEAIEAVKTVYPSLYASLQAQVRSQAATMKTPPSYQQKILLSKLFDVALDPSLQPANIASYQTVMTDKSGVAKGSPIPGAIKGAKAPHVSSHPLHINAGASRTQSIERG